jgi:hypothetical protein
LETLSIETAPEFPTAVETLDRHLRPRYVVDGEPAGETRPKNVRPTVSTELLLRNYWRLTGEIPDYVRRGQPADPEIRAQLEALEKRRTSPSGASALLDQLLVQAPYETLRILASMDGASEEVRLFESRRFNARAPEAKLYPLIVKVIADECGKSPESDSRLSETFLRLRQSPKQLNAADTTLDALRVSEALVEIIQKCRDADLLSYAV